MTQTKAYRVRDGVAWVNGARVPGDRKVRLTEAEARFDIEQGRIEPDEVQAVLPSGKAGRRVGAVADVPAAEEATDDGRD